MNNTPHTSPPSRKRRLEEVIDIAGKVFRVLFPLALSFLLIWWLLHKVDFREVWTIIGNEVDWGWLLLVMVIVTLSHMIRGFRWGIQLRAAGVGNLPKTELCCSIFGAYALNLLIPYIGEAWRILFIAKRENKPISVVLGTDIGDRATDGITILFLVGLALAVGGRYITDFMNRYAVGVKILDVLDKWWLWAAVIVVIAVAVAILYFCRRNRYVSKVDASVQKMWNGFKVLFTMKGKMAYFWLTIGIWVCYFLETYIGFLAFPFTRDLMSQPGLAWGLLPGLISFVFSSMSMAIPSNGGLGPWNLAVMFALSLFGIGDAEGTAFSLVVWSTVSLTLVILGIFTLGYAYFSRRGGDSSPSATTPSVMN